MAYAGELGMDVRVLWLHGFVLWIENEPVLDEQGQADIRAALGLVALDRVAPCSGSLGYRLGLVAGATSCPPVARYCIGGSGVGSRPESTDMAGSCRSGASHEGGVR
jgi:hypothetical protein